MTMAITKETATELNIDRYGFVRQRDITTIMEDGTVLAETYHITNYAPGADISKAHPLVKQHAPLVWTPELVAATKARIKGIIK